MKLFIKYLFYFSLFPILILILIISGYFIFDPFKVLRNYSDYSFPVVNVNRDVISTQSFLRNSKKHKYNSFIFGSSRTIAYQPESWKKHLLPTDQPFCFDASNESIWGIYKKIKFLEKIHQPINNALVIICRDHSLAKSKNQKGVLFIKDPVTSGESKIAFNKEFFAAYLNPLFLRCFYTYKLTHQYKDWMKGTLIDYRVKYDSVTNYINLIDQDAELKNNPDSYYAKRANQFYSRSGETTDSSVRLKTKQIEMLKEIKQIFDKNKTSYKIVLSPLYEQMKFSPEDFATIKGIFGDEVYDFSGKNSFTDSKYNYYEQSHYTTAVGDSIMNVIYQPK